MPESPCVRAGCANQALRPWWRLCVGCTLPLLDAHIAEAGDLSLTGGWTALDWAERIAPGCWGQAGDDGWMLTARCLAFAVSAAGREHGCGHTSTAGVAVPVVTMPWAPWSYQCPSCSETTVASVPVDGPSCDRCGAAGPARRIAAVAGTSLIVVARLCVTCQDEVLGLPADLGTIAHQ